MDSKLRWLFAALLIVGTSAFSVSGCIPLVEDDDPVEVEDEDDDE